MRGIDWGELNEATGLTSREEQLVHLMSLGYTQYVIGRKLLMTDQVVGRRIAELVARLALSGRVGLAIHYVDKILPAEYRRRWVITARQHRTAMVEAGAVTDLAKRLAGYLNTPDSYDHEDEVVAGVLGVSLPEVTATQIRLWHAIDAGRFTVNNRLKLLVVLHLAPLADI